MDSSTVYWVLTADSIWIACSILSAVSLLITLAAITESIGIGFLCFIFSILFVAAAVFIPSTKNAVAIYLLPKIASNEKLQKIPNKIVDYIDSFLDEKLEKSTQKKNNE